MIATTTARLSSAPPHDTPAAAILDACSHLKGYLRRIPPDCRSSAIAALAEVERRVRAGSAASGEWADK